MTAKEYLEQAQTLDRQIDSKIMVLDRLRALATRTTSVLSGSVVSRSRNEHSMEDTIAKIVDMEREINGDIDRLVELKREVMEVLKLVPDDMCRIYLEKRYLGYQTSIDIAREFNFSKAWSEMQQRKALAMAEQVLKQKKLIDS